MSERFSENHSLPRTPFPCWNPFSESPFPAKHPSILPCVQGSQWYVSTHFSSIIPPPLCLTLYVLPTTDFLHFLTPHAVSSLLGILPETSLLLIPPYPIHQEILSALSWNLARISQLCTIFTVINLFQKFTVSHLDYCDSLLIVSPLLPLFSVVYSFPRSQSNTF